MLLKVKEPFKWAHEHVRVVEYAPGVDEDNVIETDDKDLIEVALREGWVEEVKPADPVDHEAEAKAKADAEAQAAADAAAAAAEAQAKADEAAALAAVEAESKAKAAAPANKAKASAPETKGK